MIEIGDKNSFEYIEDVTTAYDAINGTYSGIQDKEDFYIGIALMSDNYDFTARNGWIKLQLDIDNHTLTIKEWGYINDYFWNQGGILAGETGNLTSVADPLDIQDVVTSPNPASDQVNIRYNFTKNEQLSLSAYSSIGQLIFTRDLPGGTQDVRINTQDWPAGNYMLNFNSESGVKTEQLIISK